jgi:uncharacterized protein (DUF1810 family)
MSDLQRFLDAQAPVYGQVLQELEEGEKRSHWMWFVFPQLAGLGSSPTSRHYSIENLAHARAFLTHPVLGARLRQCVQLLNGHEGLTAEQIFGFPDYLKLHSCLTLFHVAAPDNPAFSRALEKYYDARGDEATIRLLQEADKCGDFTIAG